MISKSWLFLITYILVVLILAFTGTTFSGVVGGLSNLALIFIIGIMFSLDQLEDLIKELKVKQ